MAYWSFQSSPACGKARHIQVHYSSTGGERTGAVAPGMALRELFEAVAERHPIEPTSILDYPLKVSLLSKQKPDAPNFVERFGLTPAERKAAAFKNMAVLPATNQLAALPMG